MRLVVGFVAVATLFVLTGAYVHRRTSGAFGLGPLARRLAGGALAVTFAITLLGRTLAPLFDDTLAEHVLVAATALSLAVVVAAVLLFVVDVARVIAWAGRRAAGGLRRAAVTGAGTGAVTGAVTVTEAGAGAVTEVGAGGGALPRRTFLAQAAAGSALLAGGSGSFYAALFGRLDYHVEEVTIPVPGLARTLDGFTIVQLSDIHFGTFVGEPELRAAVALVRSARPDLVVLTGDLVDHDRRYIHLVGKLVRALVPLARHGVSVIPGNHDYYTGVDDVLAAARAAGATVLRNGARVVGDRGGALALVGMDDLWAPRIVRGRGPDLERALAMAPADLPRVLLCHNPAFFPRAAGRVALQLSGHTHGGQVNVGLRLADHVLPYGYVAGLYERDGGRLWVNRGFGTAGPPARVGSPPEVTRIRLAA